MRFIEKKQKMFYLLELVEKGRLQSIQSIAERFGCSGRTIKRFISDMREDGHDIEYCRCRKKFVKKN